MERATFTIGFRLKMGKQKADGQVPIYMRITVKRERVEISIHRTIDPEEWDSGIQASGKKTDEANELNDYLQQCRSRVYQCKKSLEYDDQDVTALNLKNRYLGFDQINPGIIEYFLEYNVKVKERVGVDVAAATHQKYSVCLKHLQNFMGQELKKKEILIKDINHQFVSRFEHYLRTKVKQSHNTSVKTMRTFRTIIKNALNNDLIRKDPFSKMKLRIKSIQRDRLDEEELERISTTKIENERLATVRDIFLFSCYTGLAYSDVKALRWKHIEKKPDGRWRIVKLRIKTSSALRIPVLPQAKEIIERYLDDSYCLKYDLVLPVRSNQKMNEYLKEIATLCKIDKKLTTHIGRHTFATTVALANGLSMEVTQSILGHSSPAMTRIYAKMTDKRVDQEMDMLANKLVAKSDFSDN
jgi:integrase